MYISIDLGGTSTRIASSKDLETFHKVEKFHTVSDLSRERELVNEAVQKVSDGDDIEFICIGVPGFVDRYERRFGTIVNFPELTGVKYGDFFMLGDVENIIVENDAALAGLAESKRGEAFNHRVVAYITLSTGVGGVRIQDQKLSRIQGKSEPGHMIIIEDGQYDDVCGQKGCLHAYLSGSMFEKVYGIKAPLAEDSEIWDEYGRHLATGIINICAMWDPSIIVIGGSISGRFDMFGPSMFKNLDNQDLFVVPEILRSEMGDNNGLLGGFDLISQVLKEKNPKK